MSHITQHVSSHADRLKQWQKRMIRFTEQSSQLANNLNTRAIKQLNNVRDICAYGYVLTKNTAECGTLTRAATKYCRQLKAYHKTSSKCTNVLCRKYNLSRISCDIGQAVQIQLYISRHFSEHFLKLYLILQLDTTLFVFHKLLTDYSCLYHKMLCSAEDYTKYNIQVKQWTVQLAKAVEVLNLAGVSHRFIRPENILLTSNNQIQVASFDFACLYWSATDNRVILQPIGLSRDVPFALWDHLPPECFTDQYDATTLDSWSIGVLLCCLLVSSHPFNPTQPTKLIDQWKRSTQRARMADEFRSLLDDIFRPANQRMIAYDLAKDVRLQGEASSMLSQAKYSPYYRIDVSQIDPMSASQESLLPLSVSSSHFNKDCRELFDIRGFELLENEEAMQHLTEKNKSYIVLRNKSYQSGTFLLHYPYLQALVNGNRTCLVRIFQQKEMSVRHWNMLYTESSKIMRFMRNRTIEHIHWVEDIFYMEKSQKLYIFYTDLVNYATLLDHSFDGVRELTPVMAQLAQVINTLTDYGVSHRYIRPEYILLNSSGTIKLTHFEMACFVWNPVKLVQVLRTRALQDCQEHRWDHLPPECFQPKYDSTLVDIWSFGTVLVHCLTGSSPFTVPHTMLSATDCWNAFKADHENKLASYADILELIFVTAQNRIRTGKLARLFQSKVQSEAALQ